MARPTKASETPSASWHRVALAMLIAALLSNAWACKSQNGTPRSSGSPASATGLPVVAGSKVYFVPIDNFSEDQIQKLVHYYHDKFNLNIQVLPAIPVDASLVNASRRQLRAEKLAASVHAAFPGLAADPRNILIGLTSHDIYPESQNWRFAFGWRIPELRAAVVSTAVMDLENPRAPVEVGTREVRLRKVVNKDLGILYYGLPVNNNRKSVLYSQILGIRELDSVGEDF